MRLLAATAAALLISSSAGAVSIVNGDFEIGIAPGSYTTLVTNDTTSLPGWKVLSEGIDYIGTYWQASSGSRSLDLSALASGGIMQVVSGFEIGKRYVITFDMSANPDEVSRPKRLVMSATSGESAIYSYANSGNSRTDMLYETMTYSFIAGNTTQNIQFRSLEQNAWGAVLDNVSISEVPEPATWGLMFTGFVLVGAAARRRSRTSAIAA